MLIILTINLIVFFEVTLMAKARMNAIIGTNKAKLNKK
jgi:adenosylcobinamide amidohydrolase